MINKDIIKAISDKDMDRKDFLKYSGLALLGLVGLKTVASIITQSGSSKISIVDPQQQNQNQNQSNRGFGGGKYGS